MSPITNQPARQPDNLDPIHQAERILKPIHKPNYPDEITISELEIKRRPEDHVLLDKISAKINQKISQKYSDQTSINDINQQSLALDQVRTIHYCYFAKFEKLKLQRENEFAQRRESFKQDLQKLMPYNPVQIDYTKEEYDAEIERQLAVQHDRYVKIPVEVVLNKMYSQPQRPILLERREVVALTYLRYHRTNPEIVENLSHYIAENKLTITNT